MVKQYLFIVANGEAVSIYSKQWWSSQSRVLTNGEAVSVYSNQWWSSQSTVLTNGESVSVYSSQWWCCQSIAVKTTWTATFEVHIIYITQQAKNTNKTWMYIMSTNLLCFFQDVWQIDIISYVFPKYINTPVNNEYIKTSMAERLGKRQVVAAHKSNVELQQLNVYRTYSVDTDVKLLCRSMLPPITLLSKVQKSWTKIIYIVLPIDK